MILSPREIEILTDEVGVNVRDDYSGRGMYGRTTTAIVAESKEFIIGMLSDFVDDALDKDIGETDTGLVYEYNTLIGKVAKASQDNMGKSDIVIY